MAWLLHHYKKTEERNGGVCLYGAIRTDELFDWVGYFIDFKWKRKDKKKKLFKKRSVGFIVRSEEPFDTLTFLGLCALSKQMTFFEPNQTFHSVGIYPIVFVLLWPK